MVRQATPVLMKVALARLRNREQARDVVQDLFLKLAHDDCRVLRAFVTTLSRRFDASLRVMARHRSYDLVHRHKESRVSPHALSLEDFGNHLAEEFRRERILVHREVREAVKQLSRKQRTAPLR